MFKFYQEDVSVTKSLKISLISNCWDQKLTWTKSAGTYEDANILH